MNDELYHIGKKVPVTDEDREQVRLLEVSKAGGHKKTVLYSILKEVGYNLPSIKSRCVTRDYLVGIYFKKYFTTKHTPTKDKVVNVKKHYLFWMLKERFPDCNWGFSVTNLPNKAWLIQVTILMYAESPIFYIEKEIKLPADLQEFKNIVVPEDALPKRKRNLFNEYSKKVKKDLNKKYSGENTKVRLANITKAVTKLGNSETMETCLANFFVAIKQCRENPTVENYVLLSASIENIADEVTRLTSIESVGERLKTILETLKDVREQYISKLVYAPGKSSDLAAEFERRTKSIVAPFENTDRLLATLTPDTFDRIEREVENAVKQVSEGRVLHIPPPVEDNSEQTPETINASRIRQDRVINSLRKPHYDEYYNITQRSNFVKDQDGTSYTVPTNYPTNKNPLTFLRMDNPNNYGTDIGKLSFATKYPPTKLERTNPEVMYGEGGAFEYTRDAKNKKHDRLTSPKHSNPTIKEQSNDNDNDEFDHKKTESQYSGGYDQYMHHDARIFRRFDDTSSNLPLHQKPNEPIHVVPLQQGQPNVERHKPPVDANLNFMKRSLEDRSMSPQPIIPLSLRASQHYQFVHSGSGKSLHESQYKMSSGPDNRQSSTQVVMPKNDEIMRLSQGYTTGVGGFSSTAMPMISTQQQPIITDKTFQTDKRYPTRRTSTVLSAKNQILVIKDSKVPSVKKLKSIIEKKPVYAETIDQVANHFYAELGTTKAQLVKDLFKSNIHFEVLK
jgi:hypothetical protein